MKLLCVIPSYYPASRYGGPIASLRALNNALVEKGIDVTVYTTNVGLDQKVLPNHETNFEGVKVTYFTFTKFFEFMGTTGWQFSWPMTKTLKKKLKAFDLIYIVSVWNYPTVATAHYCKHYRKPYIISPQGALYPYTARKKFWKKVPYYHIAVKRALQGATAVHYLTRDEAEKCHRLLCLKNRAIVIPNGIDISEFNNLPEREKLRKRYPYLQDKKVILFLGRIHWIKGLDILSKAYGRLARKRNDVHLLIAGVDEDGCEKKLREWLKHEGVFDQVTFAGMVEGREKLEVFTGSDLFALPSYSEGFSMAILEAMICGLPVIITNHCNFLDVERAKAGFIIQPRDEDLYQAFARILDNKKEAFQMGLRGKKLVKGCYNIDNIADAVICKFQEILRNEK